MRNLWAVRISTSKAQTLGLLPTGLLVWGLVWASTAAAFASCGDLEVELADDLDWEIVTVGCETGEVESQSARRVVISSEAFYGPNCELTLRKGERRGVARVQQNYCAAEGGKITVQHKGGLDLPAHCSREGSARIGRAGRVTFGNFRRLEETSPADQLRVATYNVFDRSYNVVTDGQDQRMAHVPGALADMPGGPLDAVVFQESFNHDVLSYGLCKAGFPWQTPVISDPTINSVESGGIFIASRWPITSQGIHIYRDACRGADCLAAKGVVYAKVEKGARKVPYHLFGTHMQADLEFQGIRYRQADQMRRFVESRKIAESEPVLLLGDFNTDWIHHAKAVETLRGRLGAVPSVMPEGAASSNPEANPLVGLDGAAGNGECCGSYLSSRPRVCGCCPRELLDFIFVADGHRRPSKPLELKVVPLRADRSFSMPVDPYNCDQGESTWRGRDLSDHYPVVTTFAY